MALQLREGESVLYEGRPSWRALLTFYAGGLLLAVVAGAILWLLADEAGIAALVAGIIAGLTLFVGWFRRLFTKYLITSERLRISKGFIRRHVQETRLERVQNVNFQQGVLERITGVGTVDFDTAGTDDSEFRFEWVNGPDRVVHAVDEAIHRSRPGAGPAAV